MADREIQIRTNQLLQITETDEYGNPLGVSIEKVTMVRRRPDGDTLAVSEGIIVFPQIGRASIHFLEAGPPVRRGVVDVPETRLSVRNSGQKVIVKISPLD